MKKNHNIRRFICALIAAGMLTSAASTGVFADSPSNNHPGNSQTQGTPGFDQGNNANTGHGQDGTGNGSLTGEDSEPDNKPDKDNDKNEKPDKDHGHKPGKPDKDDDDDDRDDHDDDDDDKDDGVNTLATARTPAMAKTLATMAAAR